MDNEPLAKPFGPEPLETPALRETYPAQAEGATRPDPNPPGATSDNWRLFVARILGPAS